MRRRDQLMSASRSSFLSGGRRAGRTAFALALSAACLLLAVEGGAAQQQSTPKVWEIKLGTPVAELPLNEFVDPACGTNGGPPSRVLKSFADFALCPLEKATALHEVWFRYDDELEYIARARRSEVLIRQFEANALAGQPIITSLLIDDMGRVEGYRIVNDPRASGDTRIDAYGLSDIFKGMAPSGLKCTDLPAAEGERPIEDWFIKENCELDADGQITRIETRYYYKPGQYAVDPNDSRLNENQFESSARLEVYRRPK
jgi:hypothetical protein